MIGKNKAIAAKISGGTATTRSEGTGSYSACHEFPCRSVPMGLWIILAAWGTMLHREIAGSKKALVLNNLRALHESRWRCMQLLLKVSKYIWQRSNQISLIEIFTISSLQYNLYFVFSALVFVRDIGWRTSIITAGEVGGTYGRQKPPTLSHVFGADFVCSFLDLVG